MRQGERLYLEIIDHKTPLIYYLAMVPNQFWFRVLLWIAMSISTVIFYDFAQRLLKNRIGAQLATLLFILLTTLPAFEGNIPNGELFVMTVVLIGAAFFMRSALFRNFLDEPVKTRSLESIWLRYIGPFAAGIFFGLAILTKVPALFDVVAFFSIAWFLAIGNIQKLQRPKEFLADILPLLRQVIIMGVGVLLPILFSIVYSIARDSGKAFLDYGLLYNFRYADSWHLDVKNKIILFLFTLPGKTLILAIWMLALSVLRKTSRPFQFITAWFGLALFASLLSNRPYPHYYLQVFPPLCLFLGYLLSQKKQSAMFVVESIVGAIGILLFVAVFFIVHVGIYPTFSYYTRFGQLVTHSITPQEYRNSFDQYVADNEAAVKVIAGSSDPKMFIWGTDPMLYPLARKAPVGRFTVAFHIHDFHAETETLLGVKSYKPTFVVVMKNESDLPGLNSFLQQDYVPNLTFEHFVLWKRF